MSTAEQQWVFGYGSLLCPQSRRRTSDWLEDSHATLRGFERRWCANIPEASATVLGIVSNPVATCNGVLLHVTDTALGRIDERERASVYARQRLATKQLEFHAAEDSRPSLEAWGYVCVTPRSPDAAAPIVQSYVDVVLGGCLRINDTFAEEFVRTTAGWTGRWINDRQDPRYVRAVRNRSLEARVDDLLARMVPEAFSARS